MGQRGKAFFTRTLTDSAKEIERLNHFISIRNPDLLILNNHGFDSTVVKKVCLFNYTLITSYYRETHLKGGTAIKCL